MEMTVPQTCTICRDSRRTEIEQTLISGTPLRTVSDQFGPSKTALLRHRSHLAGKITEQAQARETARRGTLLEDVRVGEQRAESLYATAEQILAAALADKDSGVAVHAIRAAVGVLAEARNFLQLRGTLCGDLGRDRDSPLMTVQIICPSVESGALPRISFASDSAIESSIQEIGWQQLP
jgi:hypothetical protein